MSTKPNVWLLIIGYICLIVFTIRADPSLGDVMYVYVFQQIAILIISGITIIAMSLSKRMETAGEISSKAETIGTAILIVFLYMFFFGLFPLFAFYTFNLTITPEYKNIIWLLMIPFVLEQILTYFKNLPSEINSKYLDITMFFSKETIPRYLLLHVMVFVVAFTTKGGRTEGNLIVVLIFLILMELYIPIYMKKAAALPPEAWKD